MRIVVDGGGFGGAATALRDGNELAATHYGTLTQKLAGYAAMAGDDHTSQEFGADSAGAASVRQAATHRKQAREARRSRAGVQATPQAGRPTGPRRPATDGWQRLGGAGIRQWKGRHLAATRSQGPQG